MKIRNVILSVVVLFLLLAQVQGASAHFTFSDDNFLVDANGTRMFMVGMYEICSIEHDDQSGYESCAESVAAMSNSTFSTSSIMSSAYWDIVAPIFSAAGMYYDSYVINTSHFNEPYFLFHYQWNSTFGNEPMIAEHFDALYLRYNYIRTLDTNHPVMVGSWSYKPTGSTYSAGDVADLTMDVLFSHFTSCGYDDRMMDKYTDPTCVSPPLGYMLDDFLFAKERELRLNHLNAMGVTSIEALPDPMWTIFGGVGINYTNAPGIWRVSSKEKLRASYYWAVTVGYTGIAPWGYKIYGNGTSTQGGLIEDPVVASYYNDLAGEFNSPAMQKILTLPTINFSWNYYTTWDNKINFSTNPTRYAWFADAGTGYALTYRLKYNTTSNKYYLFVANKLNVSVSPTITIQGLTGTHTATTLGITGTGSSAPGRVLTLTNGVFSETLDAYAGIVYEIAESGNNSIPPVLSSCSATNTSSSVNVSCTGGSGNVTNSIRVYNVNTSTWNNVSTMYALNSGLNSGTSYTFRAYPYNNSGAGEINNTYTTVLGTTTQAKSTITFTVNSTNFVSFTQDNVTEDLGDTHIKIGEYANNFDNANSNFIALTGSPVFSTSDGYLNISILSGTYAIVNANSQKNTTKDINISYKFKLVAGGLYNLSYPVMRYNSSTNFSYDELYGASTNLARMRNRLSSVSNTLKQVAITPNTGTWYDAISKFNGNNREIWFNNTVILSSTDDNLTVAGKWGFGVYNASSNIDDVRLWSTSSGNFTSWWNTTTSNVTYRIVVNVTTPANTNYSVLYRQNATGDYILLNSSQSGNTTHAISTQYQNTDVRIVLYGNETATPELIAVTYYAQAPATYMPPTPISCSATQGNFWINTSCSAGTGNITDGMNKTNGTIWDNSTNFWMNNTLSPHAWDNISFYARNGSTVNTTPATLNTQISNNAPTLSNTTNQTVNEGDTVFIDIDGSDADSDTLVFSNNRIDLFTDFSSSTGKGNWTTNYSSSGITYLDIGVTDGYGGQTNYTMQITVNDIDTNTTPSITNVVNGTVGDTWGLVNFTVNQSDALTHVKYSTDSSLSSKTTNQTAGLNRSVNITGLNNGTKYYYSVFAYNVTNTTHWSNSTIQNFTTNSNVSANLVNFSFTNISNSESQIYQSSQSTIIKVDVNDSDGYITGVDVGITFLGVEINHSMTGGNDTWTYSFISGVTGTYYITHFYATDNQSGTNSTTSNLSFSVVPVISGGGGGGSSFVPTPTPTPTVVPTNKTNITLPVIVLPKQDKITDMMNSKEAVIGGFIILGMLIIVSFRSKGR